MSIDLSLKGLHNLTPLLLVHPHAFSPNFLLQYSNQALSRPLTNQLSYSLLPRSPCLFSPQAMPPCMQSRWPSVLPSRRTSVATHLLGLVPRGCVVWLKFILGFVPSYQAYPSIHQVPNVFFLQPWCSGTPTCVSVS